MRKNAFDLSLWEVRAPGIQFVEILLHLIILLSKREPCQPTRRVKLVTCGNVLKLMICENHDNGHIF